MHLDWPETHETRTTDLGLAMKEMPHDSFAARLAALRRSRGLTQEELGAAAASSQRMIAHYENTPDAQPPADVLRALATALEVSADELLGLQPLAEDVSSARYHLRKRLRRVEDLPPEDQKTVLKVVDALIETRNARKAS